MKTLIAPIQSVQRTNPLTGKALFVERTVKGAKETIQQCIVNCKYGQFWLPNSAVTEDHNEIMLTKYEAGDTFKADRDSKRTKLEAWLTANPSKTEADCTIDKAEQGEPLYSKGDIVTRQAESFNATGTQKAIVQVEQPLSFEEKMRIMAQYGVTVKM